MSRRNQMHYYSQGSKVVHYVSMFCRSSGIKRVEASVGATYTSMASVIQGTPGLGQLVRAREN